MCPACGCELAGMESLCRDCFEKQYAAPALKKKFSRNVLIFFVSSLVLFLLMLFVPRVAKFLDMIVLAGRLFILSLAAAASAMGIWESLKWRSSRDLLFWVAAAGNVVGTIMLITQHDLRWSLLILVPFLVRISMAAYTSGIRSS
jgi:hypothetical protein